MKIDWTQFKNYTNARKIDILMLEDSSFYYLYGNEGHVQIECEIDKHPTDTTVLDDFEDNYKSLCNPIKIDKVKPTVPSNDFEMKPYGICHDHIDASTGYVYDITLSNKTGNDYSYSCSVTPAAFDSICNTDTSLLDEVEEVDSENNTLELFSGALSNGDHKLIKPRKITFKFPSEYTSYQLWGVYCHLKDFGEDDHVCFQIVDIDNVLGYGANFVLKEYDEVWAHVMAKSTDAFYTPDSAPGEIPAGLYAVVLYYPKDTSKTDIKIWIDYILTIAS